MNFLPYQNSILVLPLVAQEVENKLVRRTKTLSPETFHTFQSINHPLFNGWIKENKFKISRRITHPENFLPLIVGKIEPTSKGCILFIRYQMFPGILFFIVFFCVVILLTSVFFLVFQKNLVTFIFLLLVSVGLYIIAIMDFNQKVKISRKLLERVLSE